MNEINDYEIINNNRNSKPTIVVNSASALVSILKDNELSYLRIRLHLTSIDEELISLLKELDAKFDLVYEAKELRYKDFELLADFMNSTNNRAFLAYDINGKSLFDRANLIFIINHYNIPALLKTNKKALYDEWVEYMTTYVDKKQVKKLNKTYVGKK